MASATSFDWNVAISALAALVAIVASIFAYRSVIQTRRDTLKDTRSWPAPSIASSDASETLLLQAVAREALVDPRLAPEDGVAKEGTKVEREGRAGPAKEV